MKKLTILIALLVLLSSVVFAQEACPDLTPKITECQRQSLDPKYDVSGSCKQVIGCCSNDYIKQDQDCRAKGGDSVLGVDSNVCTFLRECRMPTTTSSSSQACLSLESQKRDCENKGYTVISGTDFSGGCEYIRCRSHEDTVCTAEYAPVCGTDNRTYGNKCELDRARVGLAYAGECKTNCRNEAEVEKERKNCEDNKGSFSKWERTSGCYESMCTMNPQPVNCEWAEREKESCKSSGGSPREEKMDYSGPNSCPMIVCDYPTQSGYSSKEECESATNCFCEYKMCDTVPKGKNYESFCGKNFKPGYYCMTPKKADGVLECGGGSSSYCPQSYHCEMPQGSDWRAKGKCVKDNYGYTCPEERSEDVERRSAECEKAGGKLVKEKDKWSSSCEYSVCVSQNLKCGNVPISVGMLKCPEGYYCEQATNSGYAGPGYTQEQGNCLPFPDKTSTPKCQTLGEKERVQIKDKCYSSGGTPELKKDDYGCEVYECKRKDTFCGGIAGIQCPPGFTCMLDGNYPDAGGKCIPEKKCPLISEDELARQKNKCVVEYNGSFNVKTDAQGCTYTDCTFTRTEPQECMEDEEVKQLVQKCTVNNGSPKVKSEKGCVREVACLTEERKEDKPIKRELPPEEAKDQDLGRLFNVAFKLEEVRAQFTGLKMKTLQIAEFYETQDDAKYAEKFKLVSRLFDNAVNEVDNIKASLRDKIDKDEVSDETFKEVKTSLAKVKESMKDILKELLR